jgi:hypothetical protein
MLSIENERVVPVGVYNGSKSLNFSQSQKELQHLRSPRTLCVLGDKKLRTALVSYTTLSSEITIDIVESLAACDLKETLIVERITVGQIYFTLHQTMVVYQTSIFAMVVGGRVAIDLHLKSSRTKRKSRYVFA